MLNWTFEIGSCPVKSIQRGFATCVEWRFACKINPIQICLTLMRDPLKRFSPVPKKLVSRNTRDRRVWPVLAAAILVWKAKMPCKKVQTTGCISWGDWKKPSTELGMLFGVASGFILRLEESIPSHSLEMNHKLFYISWDQTGLSIIKPCVPRFHGFSCFEGQSTGKLSNFRNEEYIRPNPQNLHVFRGLPI